MSEEKFLYLGSSIENIEKTKSVILAMNRKGWKITHDWTVHGIIEDDYLLPSVAVAMIEGVRRAHIVGILLPGGRGTHVELGAALIVGKPVVIFADNFELLKSGGNSGRPSTFYRHPLVHVVKTQDQFMDVTDLLYEARSRHTVAA